ncbi:GNAT family N-acetyltransferase [Polynucleobacter sp. MWH-Braz-FAM2G]|uniref:GNAT family N-acetyltransferase n=1 Tax=Polynucleobacter sp. MWH-Braz-FAM2G TaxID=1855883 RepID=UPI001BFED35C|nr:GNAT family N-acetyltransferase [Polynucleobacter sp. MWH-Braz-FAM2G]QWD91187.1 GNAT family N-acetyltransferase [Polynucleobacter sp. MWH-Braz-FAM2G]
MNSNLPLKISRLAISELPQLIDCVRRCYGDTYPNTIMYNIDQLQEIIESKLMHSVVAKLDDGQIIGHCALTFDGAHNVSPEAGKMMVDPNFRGRHIAEIMAKKRIEIAQELSLPGFWTECVTNHPYSQHEMIAFNAKETGLFIGDTPATISMKGLENHPDTRMSLLAFYLPLNDRPHTIYIPSQHIEHAQSLALDLNLPRKIVSTNLRANGATTFHTVVNSSIQTANIAIDRIGGDLIAAVKHELRKLETMKLASIYLDIPIEQEAAANAYIELESIGFFWGSWMPNFSTKGDSLRLQKIYQPVDVETIVCARPQGYDIKKYVLSEWERISKK